VVVLVSARGIVGFDTRLTGTKSIPNCHAVSAFVVPFRGKETIRNQFKTNTVLVATAVLF
jgi:hypothetical protein